MQARLRPYENADFEDLTTLFDQTWGWELESTAEVREDVAELYCAGTVAQSNRIDVIEADGAVRAVLCSHVTGAALDVVRQSAYLQVAQAARQRLSAHAEGQKALAIERTYEEAFERLIDRLRQQGQAWDVELKLLVTSPAYRGRGFAAQLIDALTAHMRATHASRAMLCTDTHCHWRYYDNTGWHRLATVPWADGSSEKAFAYGKRL